MPLDAYVLDTFVIIFLNKKGNLFLLQVLAQTVKLCVFVWEGTGLEEANQNLWIAGSNGSSYILGEDGPQREGWSARYFFDTPILPPIAFFDQLLPG